MDIARIADGGLIGVKGRIVAPVAGWLGRHTILSERWVRAAVGGLFIALAARTLVHALRRTASEA